MQYKVFIDDSGGREYKSPFALEFKNNPPLFDEYPQFWRDNYFVLCGVRIHQKDLGKINEGINSLKNEYFKTKKVEIKSDWLRNPYQRKKRYSDPFNISGEKLKEFVDMLYNLIAENTGKIKLLAVVFDKRHYGQEKRQTAEGMPLIKCAQVIFERLHYTEKNHIAVFDQFESELHVTRGSHKKIINIAQGKSALQKIYVDCSIELVLSSQGQKTKILYK